MQQAFRDEPTGHDWHHIARVCRNAETIAASEGANLEQTVLAALLHDVADWKFHGGDLSAGPRKARELMVRHGTPTAWHEPVALAVERVSFKGAGVADDMPSLEGKCVQDADRLDAIGAIGVARTFAYGGNKGQPMYDPELKPEMHASFAEYRDKRTSTINHFYEKLLLLRDRMHTETGKRLAADRHRLMERFLNDFLTEWHGEVPTIERNA